MTRAGVLDTKVMSIILTNTRTRDMLENDVISQISSVKVAADDVLALFRKYGSDTMQACFTELLDYSERRTREALAAIPDGVYRHEEPLLDDGAKGGPYYLRVAITKQGSDVTLDFTGTDPQVKEPINSPLATTLAAVYYVMRCVTDASIPSTEGCKRPIKVIAPPGTLVNLPVLLNLHDPVPGPILAAGDAGTGKTALLQTVAVAAALMHQTQQLQFGVLTSHPDEWSGLENIPNNVGVFPIYHQSSDDFILSLASWAHGNKSSRQSIVLLIDDLDAVTKLDFDARQNLRWLLLRGPARRVWPIITLNPNRMENARPWLEAFHTRVFGPIQNVHLARQMDAENAELDPLNIGTQFAMREGERWLRVLDTA